MNQFKKPISLFFLAIMLLELFTPTASYALTSGPSQPEVQSFEPVGTTEMVDLFSGDFVYNIPLLDVEGYPINISYHSGVSMDEEASWVGLGWNINPGAINRNLRGLPDDFKGDVIKRETNIKPNITRGFDIKYNQEFFGKEKNEESNTENNTDNNAETEKREIKKSWNLSVGLGIRHNSYKGLGYELQLGLGASKYADKESFNNRDPQAKGGIGLTVDTDHGFGISADLNLNILKKTNKYGINSDLSLNSREGFQSFGIGMSYDNQKKNQEGGSKWQRKVFRFGGSFSIRQVIFSPGFQNSMLNFAHRSGGGFGTELKGSDLHIALSHFSNLQQLQSNKENLRSFGYFNLEEAKEKEDLKDFSRYNSKEIGKHSPFLPYSTLDYDVFAISGQGIGGTFRGFRNDIGYLNDPYSEETFSSQHTSFNMGFGDLAKSNIDLHVGFGGYESRSWLPYQNEKGSSVFKHYYSNGNPTTVKPNTYAQYEPFFLKNLGELTATTNSVVDKLGNEQATMLTFEKNLSSRVLNGNIRIHPKRSKRDESGDRVINGPLMTQERQIRSKVVTFLNQEEASRVGLNHSLYSYPMNQLMMDNVRRSVSSSVYPGYSVQNISRARSAPSHSIGEVTVLNEDGSSYIYSIPAVNHLQEQKTFNVSSQQGLVNADHGNGRVIYPSNANTLQNTYGFDHFYRKSHMPAYGHSYLLSSIVSPDYYDLKDDGVTYDDPGTAHRFNYTRAYQNYKWRVPHGGTQENTALLDRGFKSDKFDDKGSYTYGEKEIWYLHSIESKNFVAMFYLSRRADAHQVKGENGGIDTTASFYKLDSIVLYSKQELIEGKKVPIKSVHFEYDYSLCPEVENNHGLVVLNHKNQNINANKGKLTLKKIYFTYGKSGKGRLSPYQFTYSDFNPSYNIHGYDRWGNYKINASHAEVVNIADPDAPLSNVDHPYVLQNKDTADKYMGAWHLTKIKLPSGGVINIEFESDDYGYVQNHQATEMYEVLGVSNELENDSTKYIDRLFNNKRDNNNYVYFKLKTPIPKNLPQDSLDILKHLYFGNQYDKFYFKFLVDLTGEGDWEQVSGFGEIEEHSFSSTSNGSSVYDVGWVKLKSMSRTDKEDKKPINPIALASLQLLFYSMPKKAQKLFGGYEYEPDETNVGQSLRALIPAMREFALFFRNPFSRLMAKGAGQKFINTKSFIRLNSAYYQKLGGGSRVAQISVSDSWDNMVDGGTKAIYGQRYEYKTAQKLGNTFMDISSGVAVMEPLPGGDENAMRYPSQRYTVEKKWLTAVPDRMGIDELPLGEEFFPSPSVGYSKVTVINLKPSESINRTGTGKKENFFYTAKDFPVRWDATLPEIERPRHLLTRFLHLKNFERLYATQGYTFYVNDMHGRPKGEKIYAEGATEAYTEVEYHYSSEFDPATNALKLNNRVNVMDKSKASIVQEYLGRNIDVAVDTKYERGTVFKPVIKFNNDLFSAGIIPIFTLIIFPMFSRDRKDIGMATMTKVVSESGILIKTVVKENGASIDTKNLVFDRETGQVLLSETQNEYGDPVYQFNYPAHFAYEGMAGAYKNIGLTFKNVSFEDGEPNIATYGNFFFPGDEIIFKNTLGGNTRYQRGWAVMMDKLRFVNKLGYYINFKNVDVRIVRSGRRNMLNANIGSFTSLKYPNLNLTEIDSVIQSSAIEYQDKWKSSYKPVTVLYGYTGSVGGAAPSSPDCESETLCDTASFKLLTMKNLMGGSNFFTKGASKSSTLDLEKDKELFDRLNANIDTSCNRCFPFLVPGGFPPIPDPSGAMLSEPDDKEIKWASTQKSYTSNAFVIPNQFVYGEQQASLHGPSVDLSVNGDDFAGSYTAELTQNGGHWSEVEREWSFDDLDHSMNNMWYTHQIDPCWTWKKRMRLQGCPPAGPNSPEMEFIEFTRDGWYLSMSLCIRNPDNLDENVVFDWIFEYSCANNGGGNGLPRSGPQKGHADLGCGLVQGDYLMNPYVQGILGNWRPVRSWAVIADRKRENTTDLRRDGTYDMPTFWRRGLGANGSWGADTSNWTKVETMTKYNSHGQNTETKNALNTYSSALYGFDEQFPVAVAQNAQLRQIAFDGYEDYHYNVHKMKEHFSFQYAQNVEVAPQGHTGKFSVKAKKEADSVTVFRSLLPCSEAHRPDIGLSGYQVFPCDMEQTFRPMPGKYLLSAWLKQSIGDSMPVARYVGDSIKFVFYFDTLLTQPPVVKGFTANGPMIEGWQKLDHVLEIPEGATCYMVILKTGSAYTYFDDFRLHPYKSNMRSFVYDSQKLRLAAELDENNYATFYEYDDEGRLIRIKRETERGIVTIQESRTGIKKTD